MVLRTLLTLVYPEVDPPASQVWAGQIRLHRNPLAPLSQQVRCWNVSLLLRQIISAATYFLNEPRLQGSR